MRCAATAVGLEVGLDFARIAAGLAEFRGAERRFQMRGEAAGIMVVDDYGHHPTEIAAVIAAAKAHRTGALIVVFQPHRYTRTAHLMQEFATALSGADEVVLTDIYPAGEAPIPGVTVDALGPRFAGRRRPGARGPGARGAPGRGGRTRPTGRSGRDDGRGLDRRRRRSHPGGDLRTGRGADGAMKVKAPAEKNFKRAKVKPGRREALALAGRLEAGAPRWRR